MDLGRLFVPLNGLVAHRPPSRESPGLTQWPGEDKGQGFIPLSLVFVKAPLGTGLQVIRLLPYPT